MKIITTKEELIKSNCVNCGVPIFGKGLCYNCRKIKQDEKDEKNKKRNNELKKRNNELKKIIMIVNKENNEIIEDLNNLNFKEQLLVDIELNKNGIKSYREDIKSKKVILDILEGNIKNTKIVKNSISILKADQLIHEYWKSKEVIKWHDKWIELYNNWINDLENILKG